MPNVVCPECKNKITVTHSNFQDTVQCAECTKILRVLIRDSVTTSVHLQNIDLDIPQGLPENLEKILTEAINSCEAGSYASAVVMSGLFLEGILKQDLRKISDQPPNMVFWHPDCLNGVGVW